MSTTYHSNKAILTTVFIVKALQTDRPDKIDFYSSFALNNFPRKLLNILEAQVKKVHKF